MNYICKFDNTGPSDLFMGYLINLGAQIRIESRGGRKVTQKLSGQ